MATISKDLYGKIIVVTGGATGRGREFVLLLAEAGASLVIADTDENHGEDTAMEAKKKGGDAMFVKADITELREIDQIVSKTLEKFGRIDVLS
ncbi:MAG: SDR family NAD(P)-dependent oxidoreductase [Thermoproteota archaeon]